MLSKAHLSFMGVCSSVGGEFIQISFAVIRYANKIAYLLFYKVFK